MGVCCELTGLASCRGDEWSTSGSWADVVVLTVAKFFVCYVSNAMVSLDVGCALRPGRPRSTEELEIDVRSCSVVISDKRVGWSSGFDVWVQEVRDSSEKLFEASS
jgi:hypothetical protein